MPVVYSVVGATTQSSAWLRPKVSPAGATVSAQVSITSNFENILTFGPVTATSDGIASISCTGLDSEARYFYRFLVDGVLDDGDPEDVGSTTGSFRTHPPIGFPASFRIAASSCAGLDPNAPGIGSVLNSSRISNHRVHSDIIQQDPLLFIHMGDIHYYNIGPGNTYVTDNGITTYRRALDDVFKQTHQHNLYRNVATAYMYDDHDWGPNDSSAEIANHDNALKVYRERWPHYPIGSSNAQEPSYQTWVIGRVRFVLLDVRADRSRNDAEDDDDKTMLGDTQIAWLRGLLENDTTSGALVVTMGSQWIGTGSDTWGYFSTERRRVAKLFKDTGWADRMVIMYGDAHALGIDTGSRSEGGIPVFQFASLDSSSGGPVNHFDTGPSLPGRGQFGLLDIEDTGTFIIINGQAMVSSGNGGATVWKAYSHVIQADSGNPDDGGGGELPPEMPPELTEEVKWYGCVLATGQIIEELRDVKGEISKIIGTSTSSALTIPIPTSDPGLLDRMLSATEPRRTMVVAVVNDVPVWGGYVALRDRGTDPEMHLSAVSFEGYLYRRYINRDYSWSSVDEADMFIRMMAEAEKFDGRWKGLSMAIDAPKTGTRRDRTYLASDHKKVGEAFEELMGVENGPEWTIRTAWKDSTKTSFKPVLVVRKELGRRSSSPNSVFEVVESVFESDGDSAASYTVTEDFGDGKSANVVLAYSSGEGDDRPLSSVFADTLSLNSGEIVFEHHYQPSNSISVQATLDGHAKAALERMRNGSVTNDLEVRWDATPRLGYDWDLGDDVAWRLIGHGHPMGLEGGGRVVGWSLDPEAGLVKPILWNPDEEG